jgi:hypothetical protein
MFESVRRLTIYHDISLEEIEDSNVLPAKVLNIAATSGLMRRIMQRFVNQLSWCLSTFIMFNSSDLLQWTVFPIRLSEIILPNRYPEKDDIRGRLDVVAGYFCPNLNCINALCPVHRKE